MSRDVGREAVWLDDAAEDNRSGWAAEVNARLAAGRHAYSDNAWERRPASELLTEIQEECADIGGWGVLAIQRLDTTEMSADDRAVVEALVAVAARHAARAHAAIEAAAALVRAREAEWLA